MFRVSSCSCLRSIHWKQVLSWEWRSSWSSADRRCSIYIWVINNFIAWWGATYIRGFTVYSAASCSDVQYVGWDILIQFWFWKYRSKWSPQTVATILVRRNNQWYAVQAVEQTANRMKRVYNRLKFCNWLFFLYRDRCILIFMLSNIPQFWMPQCRIHKPDVVVTIFTSSLASCLYLYWPRYNDTSRYLFLLQYVCFFLFIIWFALFLHWHQNV